MHTLKKPIARSSVKLNIKSNRARYVALDQKNKAHVLAEGMTASSVVSKARRIGKRFSILFVPPRNKTCIY